MNPFSFLNTLGNSLSQYLAPALGTVRNAVGNLTHQPDYTDLLSPVPDHPKALNIPKSAPPNNMAPAPNAMSNSLPDASTFLNGFNNFGSSVPVASQSGLFARVASALPPKIDPLLPAIISLMETGGGTNNVGMNNPFNIRGTQGGDQQFINYPSLETALLGGQNGPDYSQGLVGTLNNSPYYDKFRSSGDLADFFNTYTPFGAGYGNPTMEELLSRYNSLRSLFGR